MTTLDNSSGSHHPLPGTNTELINPDIVRGRFRSVLFDFDGTLSLIRQGWPDVMIPMMVDVLKQTQTSETDEQLHETVEHYVMRLNGRQTIYQMMQLVEEVRKRGGHPESALTYKTRYHELLAIPVQQRLDAIQHGQLTAESLTVPGSHPLLENLQKRGIQLYLASGTDLTYVKQELAWLKLDHYFGQHIYGALDDYKNFSKAMIIQQILNENDLQGEELLGFGDGFVEIEEVKRVGGVSIGVASNEATGHGINLWKRERLIEAGADLIIPEYREQSALIKWLFQT